MDYGLRRASTDDAQVLTDLAMASKASWGYDDDFMKACRAQLTITPNVIQTAEVWVTESAGTINGMIVFRPDPATGVAELADLFVSPDSQGKGLGSALMAKLNEVCEEGGIRQIGVDADPLAETIYERFGFKTVGRSPSGSIPNRTLPRMERRLS